MPRLEMLSRAFQRIRYNSLRFEVVTGLPSASAGSYISGFIKDATDPVNEKTAATQLLASGGVATKWWESSEVKVGLCPDLYYTSSDPANERWASPGSFVVAAMSKPNHSGNINVYVHWDVTLSSPTFEPGGKTGGGGFCTALTDLFTEGIGGAPDGSIILAKRTASGWTRARSSDFTPQPADGTFIVLLSMRSASVCDGDKKFNGVFNFRRLKVDSGYLYPVNDKDDGTSEFFFDYDYVVFKGERGEVTEPPNLHLASWFLSSHPKYRGLSGRPDECVLGRASPRCVTKPRQPLAKSSCPVSFETAERAPQDLSRSWETL